MTREDGESMEDDGNGDWDECDDDDEVDPKKRFNLNGVVVGGSVVRVNESYKISSTHFLSYSFNEYLYIYICI